MEDYGAAVEQLRDRDPELAATLHVLDAPMLRGQVEKFIDLQSRGVDFPRLLKSSPWSTGERAMIEIACTMWGREDIADARLSPILYSLDDGNLDRVIQAMLIRRRRNAVAVAGGELDA